jgi:hypothetical protein
MKSTGENRQLGEKPVPVPLCPPQISHGLNLYVMQRKKLRYGDICWDINVRRITAVKSGPFLHYLRATRSSPKSILNQRISQNGGSKISQVGFRWLTLVSTDGGETRV